MSETSQEIFDAFVACGIAAQDAVDATIKALNNPPKSLEQQLDEAAARPQEQVACETYRNI